MYYDNRNLMQRTSQPQTQARPKKKEVRTPKIDVFETEEKYFIRLSLPGVKKEHLKIFFNEQGLLEVKGEVITTLPANTQKVIVQEIFEGPFQRQIRLPNKLDKRNIDYSYDNGVLIMILSK
ncbi:Hsp20/alpha crystallin family protein [Bacillus sp. HMF5848]|uniref:Hsp20/alpha crystallin family protein n=1 Tax=Bacillus sp. HMF5848 TaxID=2495421 RepID=UPI000F77D346|nr:Hsp20/alpha crystallin family protein [Bacillus sp. HMF5848]RSK27536.1 Hsp20/alpha crystallin family protein [Bacillus sp. HMF5848]